MNEEVSRIGAEFSGGISRKKFLYLAGGAAGVAGALLAASDKALA